MYSKDMVNSKKQSSWTLLSNHGHILVHINRNPDSKVKEIAEAVGITERSALSILSDLETDGYITIERIWSSKQLSRQQQEKFSPSK